MAGMSYKHKPLYLDDVVFADDKIKEKLNNYVVKRHFPIMMLYGEAGTGKTTIAELFGDIYFQDQLSCGTYREFFQHVTATWDSEQAAPEKIYKSSPGKALASCAIFDKLDYFPKDIQKHLVIRTEKQSNDNEKRRARNKCISFGVIYVTDDIGAINKSLLDYCELIHVEKPSAEQWLPRAKALVKREGFNPVPDDALLELINYSDCNSRRILRELENHLYEL